MKKREKFTLFFWLAFCAFVCTESWRLGLGSFRSPGPGFLPFGASLGTGLLTLTLLLKGRSQKRIGDTPPLFQEKRAIKVFYTLSILFIYPLLLGKIGFFLCTLLFIGFSLRMIEPQKWRVVLGMSILVAVTSFLLFNVWLQIQLPKGTWVDLLWK